MQIVLLMDLLFLSPSVPPHNHFSPEEEVEEATVGAEGEGVWTEEGGREH